MLSTLFRLLGCAALLLVASPSHVQAYVFLSPSSTWPDGNIRMDLQLGTPGGVLIDGNTSWNTVAENALARWNYWINTVQFALYTVSPKSSADGDDINQVFFSSTIYGDSFGTYTLAVTTHWRIGTRRTEADTVFNVNKPWNSYSGNLRSAAGGGTLNDLYRVAVHEFGHSLGLDHPDDWGQSRVAVMNSAISNVDDLTNDDELGAMMLYYRLAPTISSQPESRMALVGGSATFSVVADGIPSPDYQWYRSGSPISGATDSSVTVINLQTNHSGAVKVLVSNSQGSIFSATVMLTVIAPPSIAAHPQSKTVTVGNMASFSVTAAGSPPFNYQWQRDGIPIAGATSATYAISNVQADQAGNYTVVVSNGGGSLVSATAILSVNVPPSFTTHPQTTICTIGGSVMFSSAGSGTAPFSFQWYRNGVPIAGAISASYVINSAQASDAADYKVRLSNPVGTVESAVATLTVHYSPTISVQPQSRTTSVGGNVTLSVTANSVPAPSYQWFFNGDPISGAVAPSYTISSAQLSASGNYSVSISNSLGGLVSASAIIDVLTTPLAVSVMPINQVALVGNQVAITAEVVSAGPFSCQWWFKTRKLANQTNMTLTLPNVKSLASGDYQIEVKNNVAAVRSAAVRVTVVKPPIIVSPTRNITARSGKRVTLRVAATGSKPLNYQWSKDGAVVDHATNRVFTINAVQAGDAGTYSVRVSNVGAYHESVLAQLSVFP